MKILLLGKNGQVGSELQSILSGAGELTAWDRENLDLSAPEGIGAKVSAMRPDIIFNAAAYTAVDKAESEPGLAMSVNGEAPGVLAKVAAEQGALLVHYSTDYVFDGTKSSPYTEQDVPSPLNEYGRSKLAGERAVCAQAGRFLIFRTAWVYDAHGRNFLNTIRRAGAQRPELRIVDDQTGAPTWSREIARATWQAVRGYLEHPVPEQKRLSGIYHLTAQGQTTWFEFARVAAEYGLFSGLGQPPALRAIPSSEYPTPTQRPMYSVLSNARLREQFGVQLPDWKLSLQECMKDAAGKDQA